MAENITVQLKGKADGWLSVCLYLMSVSFYVSISLSLSLCFSLSLYTAVTLLLH